MNLAPRERNRLLAALPEAEYAWLQPQLETVAFDLGDPLYEPHQPLRYVWFPQVGVFSLTNLLSDGTAVEFGTVGNEGFIGLPVFLGGESLPSRCFSQAPRSTCLRLPAPQFREAVQHLAPLQQLLQRYTLAFFSQVAQSATCNRVHALEERCARWLLMTHDRVEGDEFFLTQEFLSMMLGVRRPSVSIAASILHKAGLIHYSRGHITVVDRPGLEAASCECYAVIRREFDRLIGGSAAPAPSV